jgi:hypothetical protein
LFASSPSSLPTELPLSWPRSSSPAPTTNQVASSDPELRPDGVLSGSSGALVACALERGADEVSVLGSERPGQGVRAAERELRPVEVRTPRSRIEPLAPARYKVQFTASAELRDKLERLQALMRSSVPDGDLAAIIEAAVTEKLRSWRPVGWADQVAAEGAGEARPSLARRLTGSVSRRPPTSDGRPRRDEERCRYVARRTTVSARVSRVHHRHPSAWAASTGPRAWRAALTTASWPRSTTAANDGQVPPPEREGFGLMRSRQYKHVANEPVYSLMSQTKGQMGHDKGADGSVSGRDLETEAARR